MKLEKKGLQIDPAIFESFNKLISDDEKVRLKGASGLIKIIEDASEEKVKAICFEKMCSQIKQFSRFSSRGCWITA